MEMSAVEWYKNELNKIELTYLNKVIDRKVYMDLKSEAFEQAKEMQEKAHKETWEKAHIVGMMESDGTPYMDFEQYYNENFKSE